MLPPTLGAAAGEGQRPALPLFNCSSCSQSSCSPSPKKHHPAPHPITDLSYLFDLATSFSDEGATLAGRYHKPQSDWGPACSCAVGHGAADVLQQEVAFRRNPWEQPAYYSQSPAVRHRTSMTQNILGIRRGSYVTALRTERRFSPSMPTGVWFPKVLQLTDLYQKHGDPNQSHGVLLQMGELLQESFWLSYLVLPEAIPGTEATASSSCLPRWQSHPATARLSCYKLLAGNTILQGHTEIASSRPCMYN